MLTRKLKREVLASLRALEGLFSALTFSADEIAGIVSVIEAVDSALRDSLPPTEYSLHSEVLAPLCSVLQNTTWDELPPAEIAEVRETCQAILVGEIQLVDRLPTKKIMIFLPYKASMWDSLESVWRAASEDIEHTETYVVPIPYADRNPDGSARAWHVEAADFPKYVPVSKWQDFTYERLYELQPDAIFIHNPYDALNYVTSVHSAYYSDRLKECTPALCYIPYYSTTGGMAEMQAMCPAYKNVDAIFVQHEWLTRFFDESVRYKIYPLGSPKFDRAIELAKNPPLVPRAWREKIKDKKVYFYNTSIGGLLNDTATFLAKMRYVFDTFREHEEACILWRPHPLLETSLQSMRPASYEHYLALKEYFIQNDIGIYDDTPDIEASIAIADVYIGDSGTSVTSLFGVAGKPEFILNNNITRAPLASDRLANFFVPASYTSDEWLVTATGDIYHRLAGHSYEHYMHLGEFYGEQHYLHVHAVGDRLYICPLNARDVLVVKDRRIIGKIALADEESRPNSFSGAHLVGDRIVLLPLSYPYVVVIDTRDDSVRYLEGLAELIRTQVDSEWLIGGSAVLDGRLYLAAIDRAAVYALDPATGDVSTLVVDPSSAEGFSSIAIDGTTLWLAPMTCSAVYSYDLQAGHARRYSIAKMDIACPHPTLKYDTHLYPLGLPAITASIVYYPALRGDKFLKIDKQSGTVTDWQVPVEASLQSANPYYTSYSVGLMRNITDDGEPYYEFFHYPSRTLYRLDLATGVWERLDYTLRASDIATLAPGFAAQSEYFLYGCNEDTLNSLADLLNGTLKGGKFSSARQLELYTRIAANLDGTAGEKIYRFVSERK